MSGELILAVCCRSCSPFCINDFSFVLSIVSETAGLSLLWLRDVTEKSERILCTKQGLAFNWEWPRFLWLPCLKGLPIVQKKAVLAPTNKYVTCGVDFATTYSIEEHVHFTFCFSSYLSLRKNWKPNTWLHMWRISRLCVKTARATSKRGMRLGSKHVQSELLSSAKRALYSLCIWKNLGAGEEGFRSERVQKKC